MRKAVVLGGGMAGMLAAAALAQTADRVIVVEGDRFPESPLPRRGLPQGHHNHMFMSGGCTALEKLLPGALEALSTAGAKRRGMPSQILTLSAQGWYRRHQGDASVIACSRELLDHKVRQLVLSNDRIELRESTKIIGLSGTAGRVTGAQVERDGSTETIDADLTVDATGRTSHAPDWLVALGLPRVQEELVDAGFAYASRLYRAPAGARPDFPGVLVEARAGTGRPGRGAALMPNEGDRWIVALIGTRGGTPPTDEAGFREFMRSLDDPIIGDLVDQATPAGDIRAYRGLPNRRRRYEKLPVPEGFVVVGDAATTLNPNYATGMSVAALGALFLRDEIARTGTGPQLSRRLQAGIAKAGDGPWQMATGTDQWYPDVTMNIRRAPRLARRFAERFAQVTTQDAALSNLSFNVASLQAPPASMMTVPALLTVLRGRRQAPLTAAEAIAQYPEFGTLTGTATGVPAPRAADRVRP